MVRQKKWIYILSCFLLVVGSVGCTFPQTVAGENEGGPFVVKNEKDYYVTLYEAVEEAKSADTLILLRDLELSRTVNVRNKVINILNNNEVSIICSLGFKEELFFVESNAELHLVSSGKKFEINGRMEEGRKSLIRNEGRLFLEGENIILCENYTSTPGGGVWNSGQFEMKGGVVEKNKSFSGKGGGIYCVGETSIFILKGGVIRQNEAFNPFSCLIEVFPSPYFGGGVACERGKILIQGGEIYANYSRKGGGVGCLDGEVIVEAGKIFRNKAGWGGGVFTGGFEATFIIENGEIFNNIASIGGGGVSDVSTQGKLILKGGKIYSNKLEGGGCERSGGISAFDSSIIISNKHKILFDNIPCDLESGYPPIYSSENKCSLL